MPTSPGSSTRELPPPPVVAGRHAAEVWRANQLSRPDQPGHATGFATLDAQLPGAGWPPGALTELLLAPAGHGEWRLLAPTLARLSQEGQLLVWTGAPGGLRPYAPALRTVGLHLPGLLWVDAASAADAAWSAEQALATQGCGAVVCWAPELPTTALRRLHLAARESSGLLFVIRSPQVARQSSPAPLRLACEASAQHAGRLAVTVLKRRGPPCDQALLLDTRPLLGQALAHHLRRLVPTPSTVPAQPVPALRTGLPTALPTGLPTPGADHAVPTEPPTAVAVPASA